MTSNVVIDEFDEANEVSELKIQAPANCSLAFRDVSITVGDKEILRTISGDVESGKMTCILGASGAGKTTFMNFLSGRLSPATYEILGDLYAYGEKVSPREFRDNIAYVEQEDSLLPLLTPSESVEYVCRLRTSLDANERSTLVKDIIEKLKLTTCADTYVGNKLIRGISGGQKKRTAIAQELVFDPKILFLDEPTSGLDSFNALNTMSVIKELSQTVVATIHQPSSQLFHLFDNVLILSEGHIMYSGPIKDVEHWSTSLDKPCPYGYNLADHSLHIIETASPEELSSYRQSFENQRKLIELQKKSSGLGMSGNKDNLAIRQRSFLMQWWILLQREFTNFTRDRIGFLIGLCINIFISVLVGTIFWQAGKDANSDSEIQSRSGAITFACINTMFANAQPTLLTFQFSKPVFVREYQNGLYGVVPYFLGRIFIEFIKIFFNCVVQLTIVYNMIGFSGSFLVDLCILTLMANVCATLALILGCMTPNIESAFQMITLVFVPQIIFCGFFVGIDQIPDLLHWANYLCALKYGIANILMEEFGENDPGTDLIFDRFELDRSDIARNYLILFAMFLAGQVVAAAALKRNANSY